MIKIGIECESIEGESWGVGRVVKNLLEEISRRPELSGQFQFYLYFKERIPDYAFLDNQIFIKKITRPGWLSFVPFSFNIHYHIYLIARAYLDGVSTLYFANYMLPMLWFKKSIVMLTDDVFYEMNSSAVPFRYRLAYNIFCRWAALRATRIMAISETSRQHVARLFGIKATKIFTNYLGIEQSRRQWAESSKENENTSPSSLAPRHYLLFVGQAFPRRHLKESLEAFEKIAPEFPDLQFIAVGGDKYNPPIVDALVGHINGRLGSERIIRKHYVTDEELAELFKNAQAVVYISTKEAFGLPPLEALAYGTAPIIANTTLTHELFHDSAFFVERAGSPDDIAKVMKEALTDTAKRQRIIDSGKHIISQYTWKAHTDKFLEVARQIAVGN